MSQILTRLLLALLAFYKRWLSPALHTLGAGGCKFQPTCSEYAATAIEVHGPLRGGALAVWRLLRCHPFTPGGFDPVPPVKIHSGERSGEHFSNVKDLSSTNHYHR
jgi:hypothetical protein